MKKFAEIKQYIEKELHAKRFLQEGLDVVTTLENAADELREIQKQIADGKKQVTSVESEIEAVNKSLATVKTTLSEKSETANTVIERAKERAEKIVAEAKAKADKLVEDTTAELATVRNNIATYKEEEKQKIADIAELDNTKNALTKDIEKIRKKFAGE